MFEREGFPSRARSYTTCMPRRGTQEDALEEGPRRSERGCAIINARLARTASSDEAACSRTAITSCFLPRAVVFTARVRFEHLRPRRIGARGRKWKRIRTPRRVLRGLDQLGDSPFAVRAAQRLFDCSPAARGRVVSVGWMKWGRCRYRGPGQILRRADGECRSINHPPDAHF